MATPKIMDFDTDWKRIIDEELSFLINEGTVDTGTDFRHASFENAGRTGEAGKQPGPDPRESILKAIVQAAAYN